MNIKSASIIIIALLVPVSSVASSSAAHEAPSTPSQRSDSQAPKPEKKYDRKSKPLDFSGTGRPGQQTAGESRGSCLGANHPISAMLPASNWGKTILPHPRFWVYIPEIASQNTEIEFIIQNESREDIWRSRSALNSTRGYQNFNLPKTEAPLQVGQWYRWYVKVYCKEQVASTQYVQGWVSRIPLSSELDSKLQQNPQQAHLVYGDHQIWYDAIDRLLSSYHCHPQSLALKQDWQNFIRAKGVQLEELPTVGGGRIVQH